MMKVHMVKVHGHMLRALFQSPINENNSGQNTSLHHPLQYFCIEVNSPRSILLPILCLEKRTLPTLVSKAAQVPASLPSSPAYLGAETMGYVLVFYLSKHALKLYGTTRAHQGRSSCLLLKVPLRHDLDPIDIHVCAVVIIINVTRTEPMVFRVPPHNIT
jgi:hypothetical protein